MTMYKSNLPLSTNWWKDDDTKVKIDNQLHGSVELVESLLDDYEGDTGSVNIPENTSISMRSNVGNNDDNASTLNEDGITKKDGKDLEEWERLFRGTTLDQSGELDLTFRGRPQDYSLHQRNSDDTESEGRKYEMLCEKAGVAVSRKLVKVLDKMGQNAVNLSNKDESGSNKVSMKNYGLNELSMCVGISAVANIGYCTNLDLEGNKLTKRSLNLIVSMLMSSRVEILNLSSSEISRFGPKILSKWLQNDKSIKTLILRDNQFNDADGSILFDALSSNRSLNQLDLAHNNFFVGCGEELKTMMEDNYSIENLDLSWNNLRLASATYLARGLKKNSGILTLNLSWNGFGDVGSMELGGCLRENETLEELVLVSNRITDEGLGHLMSGLEYNTTLRMLRIGRNNISEEAIHTLLTSIVEGERFSECALEELDLKGNVYLSGLNEIMKSLSVEKPEFQCFYGYEDTYGRKKEKGYNAVDEALLFLKKYVDENDINLVELFEKFDTDGSMSVNYDEFRAGLREADIPITENQVNQLIQYLDADGDGDIDFSELVLGAESHAKRTANVNESAEESDQLNNIEDNQANKYLEEETVTDTDQQNEEEASNLS